LRLELAYQSFFPSANFLLELLLLTFKLVVDLLEHRELFLHFL
jgi:hypothetical protein